MSLLPSAQPGDPYRNFKRALASTLSRLLHCAVQKPIALASQVKCKNFCREAGERD